MKNTIKAFLFPPFSLTVKVFAKMQPNQVKLQLIIAPIWKTQRLGPAPTPDKTISCISTLFIKILDIVANTKKKTKSTSLVNGTVIHYMQLISSSSQDLQFSENIGTFIMASWWPKTSSWLLGTILQWLGYHYVSPLSKFGFGGFSENQKD